MGAQASCCATKDSELDKHATTGTKELAAADAVPVDEGKGLGAGKAEDGKALGTAPPPVLESGTYSVTLDKSSGGKLGLDVDYMVERRVLPIMCITGGLAEQWNSSNPSAPLRKGDGVIEVNGTKDNVAIMLEKCKSDSVLNLVVAKAMTYDHLVADLENLINTKNCGPILIRLSWHDAGVFMDGKGGCPNAALRHTNGGEGTWNANAGLPTVALSLLGPVTDKYVPSLISHADLWVLAANVAIRVMGGPDVPTRFGRRDAPSAAEGCPVNDGRLPDADKGAAHLRAIFHPKGLDDKAIVALSGAHTVGKCSLDRSGFDGKWSEEPLKFDNGYFKDLTTKSYTAETTTKGCPQHRHAASGTIMLPSDLALLEDAAFKQHVDEYAKDQAAFFADFKKAWVKLQESGCELRDIL